VLVLPHQNPRPFVLVDGKPATIPELDVPVRDHYREFVDAVLGGNTQPCSAGFDYSGPLTESVLIGNVAAHFPEEPLEFDARKLTFQKRREANEYLTRSYRKGWRP
jgi:hypothetical protein